MRDEIMGFRYRAQFDAKTSLYTELYAFLQNWWFVHVREADQEYHRWLMDRDLIDNGRLRRTGKTRGRDQAVAAAG